MKTTTIDYNTEYNNLIEYVCDTEEDGTFEGEFRFSTPYGGDIRDCIVIGLKDMMAMMRKCGFVA